MKISEVIYFGVTYALIFTGYYVTNGFLTIIYPNEAFIGFAIFYGLYALFSLVSPFIFSKINLKLSLIISSFTFLIYVGFASSKIPALMLVGSGICGLGNAVIWLSQGQWMTAFPNDDKKATLMGIFFGIFYANILVGNIIGIIVLVTSSSSISIMMWTMIGVTGIGFIMTFFIPFKKSNSHNNNKNFFVMLKEVFTIITVKRGYLLVAFFFAQAIDLNVTYQTIPKLIVSSTSADDKNVYTAATFIAYGFSAMIFSYVWGKIYDKLGWKLIVFPYVILDILCLIGILLLGLYNSSGPLGYWILIGFFRGIIDNAVNTIINVSITHTYNDNESGSCYAFYRFVYATSYVVFAIIVAYIHYPYFLLICGIIALLSTIFYIFFPQKSELEKEFDNSKINI